MAKQSVNLKEYTSNMTRVTFIKIVYKKISNFFYTCEDNQIQDTLFAYDNTGCFAIYNSKSQNIELVPW